MVDFPTPDENGEFSDEQAHEFVTRMLKGAEIGRAIAARRVPRAVLGDALDQWVDLLDDALRTALAYEAGRATEAGTVWEHVAADFPIEGHAVDLRAWRGAPDSPAEADLRVWREGGWTPGLLQPSHQQDRGPVLHLGRRVIEAAIDHLRGIAVLMRDRRTTRPPLALARVVLEATVHVHHLLEPGVEPAERLVRAFNEMLRRLGEDYNEAVRDEDGERTAALEADIQQILNAFPDLAKNWKKKDLRIPFLGSKRVNTGALARAMLGGELWNQLSGIVHLKEDEGWRLMLGLGGDHDNPHVDMYVALPTAGALIGISSVVDRLGAYTGWDLSPAMQTHEVLLNLWADGSGMRDDEHRAAVLAARAT